MDRPNPFLVGDDVALDFLNSVAAPWSEKIEWLADGADLVNWLVHAGIVPGDVADEHRTGSKLRALNSTATKARELREWFRAFVTDHAGRPLAPNALKKLGPLNELLSRDDMFRQIERPSRREIAGSGDDWRKPLQWSVRRHWQTPDALLFPIAQAMGDLVCEKDFSLVRKCEAPACNLFFHDVSKAHARRWCSMSICGNRAKAASHRARNLLKH